MWTQVPTANKIASVIKSIQSAEGEIPSGSYNHIDVTITAVVVAKSVCYFGGWESDSAADSAPVAVLLGSSTMVRIQREQYIGGRSWGRFTVVEYY
jgi:hypothetical protein